MSELVLVLRLAGQRVALAAEQVESVVEVQAITPVPGAAPHVAGLAALRSRVLTVIDCLVSLQLGAAEGVRDAVVAVVDGHPYALLVDSVEDVVETSGEVRPLAAGAGSGWDRAVRGSVDAAGDLMLLLDAAALVAGPAAEAA